MPTKRPRVNVTLHRFTNRVLQQYAQHHGLSVSELVPATSFLVALMIHDEAMQTQAENGVAAFPPEVLLDLYRAHPDYEPDHAAWELREPISAIDETIRKLITRRQQREPETKKARQADAGRDNRSEPGKTNESRVKGLYTELVEATRAATIAGKRMKSALDRRKAEQAAKDGVRLPSWEGAFGKRKDSSK